MAEAIHVVSKHGSHRTLRLVVRRTRLGDPAQLTRIRSLSQLA